MKRISLSHDDACHLYELAYQNFQISDAKCVLCTKIKKRLENFIGKEVSESIQKIVKKNPY
jgi:hypothetical protein